MLLHCLHGLFGDVSDKGLIIGRFAEDRINEVLIELWAQLVFFYCLLIELRTENKSVLADITPETEYALA